MTDQKHSPYLNDRPTDRARLDAEFGKPRPLTEKIKNFSEGQRVQLHPATELWMRGARYGTVVGFGRRVVRVEVDALRRVVGINPDNLLPLDN